MYYSTCVAIFEEFQIYCLLLLIIQQIAHVTKLKVDYYFKKEVRK